jgi:hypothetical protein
MIDPWNGDLYIATKGATNSAIYQATRAQIESGAPVELTFVRIVPFKSVSAGDISPDGTMIAFRRSNHAEVWIRSAGDTISNALATASMTIPVVGQPSEPNGEGLGFHPTGLGYYTISEGNNQPIYFFQRIDSDIPSQPRRFISSGESWHYLDLAEDLDVIWRAPEFDDSYWFEGSGQFGYGQGDEQTTLYFGDPSDKLVTTYFRKQFDVASLASVSNLVARVCFNDGIAVYLNGLEVWRHNLPADATIQTRAIADRGLWQNIWWSVPLDLEKVHSGLNTIAVEVHRYAPDGPDLSFDLQLVEGAVDEPVHFTTAPFLSSDLCTLYVKGPVGALITIEASSDLWAWSVAARIALDNNGGGTFQEPVATTGARFYRVGVDPAAPN